MHITSEPNPSPSPNVCWAVMYREAAFAQLEPATEGYLSRKGSQEMKQFNVMITVTICLALTSCAFLPEAPQKPIRVQLLSSSDRSDQKPVTITVPRYEGVWLLRLDGIRFPSGQIYDEPFLVEVSPEPHVLTLGYHRGLKMDRGDDVGHLQGSIKALQSETHQTLSFTAPPGSKCVVTGPGASHVDGARWMASLRCQEYGHGGHFMNQTTTRSSGDAPGIERLTNPSPAGPHSPTRSIASSVARSIEALTTLRNAGVLSEEEYRAKVLEVLK